MASFGSIRVAKGVRLSASSRGLRAHVGARGARIHVGGGRTGVSTGAGPFTYYTSGSGRQGTRSRAAGGPTKTQLAQLEKEREGLALRDQIMSIVEIHRVDFPCAVKPTIAEPADPDLRTFVKKREKEQLAGVSWLRLSQRKEAKMRARAMADEDLAREQALLTAQHQAEQAEVDHQWDKLLRNDPETVIAAVDEAFEDNHAPAAPVDVENATLSLVMLAPGSEDIPGRKPSVTPSGKPTVKNMTKAERADLYLTLVCGHLLATTKEALAVAPSIERVKAVVIRDAGPDIYGNKQLEALVAASYERGDLERVNWAGSLPSDIVQVAATDLLWNLKGRPPQLTALDLDDEPELKTFIQVIAERLGQSP